MSEDTNQTTEPEYWTCPTCRSARPTGIDCLCDATATRSDSFDDVKLDYFVFGRWVPETDLTEAERVAWLNETLGVSK